MKANISKETAEARVVRKYNKLYTPLVELVSALQNLEPGGTLVDEAKITKTNEGTVRVAYKARPIRLVVVADKRKFTLRVDELN